MLRFIVRRLGVMIITMVCLTLVVFYLVNLKPNLLNLATTEIGARSTQEEKENWLSDRGYNDAFLVRYGQWLGVWPKEVRRDAETDRILKLADECFYPEEAGFYGVIQGHFGCSSRYDKDVSEKLGGALANTGYLMLWVMIIMIPSALVIGVVAGMREGSTQDRTLSVISIASTATPEYVSGVIFAAIFASTLGWLNASAFEASQGNLTFSNFALPVITTAVYGMGYIARMTRASMAEVMTAQYIRTARLKGLQFRSVVMRHALRNALIAPFTVIMLQFPWLLTGVVVVELLFAYEGFGRLLVEAAGSNDVDLLLACSIVSVLLVLLTQLISDIGYVFLNPRIRVG